MKRSLCLTFISIMLVVCMLVISIGAVSENSISNEGANDTAGQNNASAVIDSREEVIYALLSADGSTEGVYAVNILNISQGGTIQDNGSYSQVKNLTNTEELTVTDDGVSFDADSGRFYYQGEMNSTELPWNIEITYTLDGEKIKPEDLAGSDGHLEINILVTQNENVDSSYFENCMMQISVTLSTENAKEIYAPNATVANSGSDKLLTYTVMPGAEGNVNISADVEDFEMDGISFSALPYSMSLDLDSMPEVTDALESLTDAISQLSEGASQLSAGVEELSLGSEQLKNGSDNFKIGLDSLSQQSSSIVNASGQIKDALDYISLNISSSQDLSILEEMVNSLSELTDGLNSISDGITQLSEGFDAAWTTLEQTILAIPDGNIDENALQQLYAANPENQALAQLMASYEAAQTVKAVYQNVKDVFDIVENNLPAFADAIDNVTEAVAQTMGNIGSIDTSNIGDSLTALSNGISVLSENYNTFHSGLTSYISGVNSIASAYGELNTGIASFADGTGEISQGAEQLSEGLESLDSETSSIPEMVEEMVSGGESYTPISFVDEANGELSSIQFVLRTDSITKVNVEEVAVITNKEESVWDRFLALFD